METALKIIEILGIIAFALTGMVEARKKGMDIVGVYFVSMMTAFGGGTIRDLILDIHPLFWIKHSEYPVIILGLSIASYLGLSKIMNDKRMILFVVILDALGLGLFGAVGTSLALAKGLTMFNAVLMGVVTGVFGGIMRDIMCQEIPTVFKQTELYGTCVLIGAIAYLIILYLSHSQPWALGACIALTFTTRVLAYKFHWKLPV
jgi:uncharacterized membrane protein YeiH